MPMKPYLQDDPQKDLDELPPLQETEGYVIVDGKPRVSMRLDSGSVYSKHRLGIWQCTPGTFSCTEKGDELQTIISGKLTLISEDGQRQGFGPGDSIYTTKGQHLTWKITETVQKVFFTHDSNGVD